MAYIFDLSDAWAASGTTFTGIKLNVTDTASAAGSLLMDLQVGGSSKFSVAKDGAVVLNPVSADALIRSSSSYSSAVSLNAGVVGGLSLYAGNTAFSPGSAIYLTVYSGYDGAFDGTRIFNGVGFATRASRTALNVPDTILLRDAANTLAQRNGVNAQAFNLYNTYTDASNYERGFMRFVSNVLRIGTEKLGTGTARALELQVDGATRLSISINENYILGNGTSSGGSGLGSTAIGRVAVATGPGAVAIGHGTSSGANPIASGAFSMVAAGENATGRGSEASASFASIFGGSGGLSDKYGQDARGFNGFAVRGDAQASSLGFVGATTNDTATEIFLFNAANQRAVVPANKTWAFVLTAVARSSGGTDNAMYVRRGIIKRDGANNTTLVGAVDSVYTNETNAAWDIDVSADDTNESLKVTVTGAAATNIRWVAKVELTEVLFA